jgi:hypothetical protein
MYDRSGELKFPLMSGPSVSATFRRPPPDLPLEVELESALAAGGALMLGGLANEYLVGLRVRSRKGPDATPCYVPIGNSNDFSPLVHASVHMFRTGKELGVVAIPEQPSNCNWGPGFRGLYVTARTSVYFVPVKVTGTRTD